MFDLRRMLCLASSVLCSASALVAQYAWRQSSPGPRDRACVTHDPVRGQTLLHGGFGTGSDSWSWTGSTWTQLLPLATPARPTLGTQNTVYDSVRERVVLMQQGDTQSGMWAWDGSTWTRQGAALPFDYSRWAMAYDAGRQQIVLFGGSHNGWGVRSDETWLWDGTAWARANPAHRPSPRAAPGLAYDASRGRTVLFGGAVPHTSDTWEWDGQDWQLIAASTGTPSRYDDRLAFQPGLGIVRWSSASAQDFYLWLNATWIPIGNGPAPTCTESAALVFDTVANALLLFGTNRPQNPTATWVSATWQLTSTGWQQRWTSPTPGYRNGVGMLFDPGTREVMLLGDSFPTMPTPRPFHPWTWDGTRWQEHASAGPLPTPRGDAALAHDGGILVFGGALAGTPNNGLGDTWRWNGTSWTQLLPAQSPPPRCGAAMAFDAARGSVLLYGGRPGTSSGPWFSDTWRWDGATWTRLSPASSPAALSYPALVDDRSRGRLLLVGGEYGKLETWEWDGVSWTQSNAPMPVVWPSCSLAYDDQNRRVLMAAYGTVADLWQWAPSGWALLPRGTGFGAPVAWDSQRQRLVAYTGGTPCEWGPDAAPMASSYGNGCAGSGGVPLLSAGTLPWLGERFVVTLAHAHPGALLIGASRTAWGSTPLPLPLAFLGMPGCTLQASIDVALPLAVTSIALPVPQTGALIGAPLYLQGLAPDASANAFGAVLSNALEAHIGSR